MNMQNILNLKMLITHVEFKYRKNTIKKQIIFYLKVINPIAVHA